MGSKSFRQGIVCHYGISTLNGQTIVQIGKLLLFVLCWKQENMHLTQI